MEPITRTEKLMAGQQLEPITRKELFLAKAAGMDVETPEPITREEMFLNMITGGGGGGTPGGGGGGSTASVPWNDVTFIDYDGTVLHSYTLEEAQALTELPPLPEQKGLICQGWNWSLEDIKAQNGPVIVGAMYITDDGKTRIYITLHEGRTSPMLGVCPKGTVTVDWGDGTESNVLTGTSTSTVKWTPTHNYEKPGDYVISLSVDGEMGMRGSQSTNEGSSLLRYKNGADARNNAYVASVRRVELGEGVMNISNGAFARCYSLESVVIPYGVESVGNGSFSDCYALTSIVLPDGFTEFITSSFTACYSLSCVSVPNSVTSFGMLTFNNCYALTSIVIPKSVESIGDRTFINCYGMRYYDFSACTSVPTLENTSAFTNIPADCQMLIPSALYGEWSTATNWATYASKMVAV